MITTASKSTTADNPINELIAKVIDRFDTNKDKQLSASEFGSFLQGLLGGSGASVNASVNATPNTSTAAAAGDYNSAAAFNPTPCNPGLMHGFAADNYYNSGCTSMKYKFARIAADYDPRQPGALGRLVSDPRFAAAFPNAKVVGKDAIDFGGQWSDGVKGVPVTVVDVGEAFLDNGSGPAWQWLDIANMGA
jgi:hypothetical protein